MKISLVVALIKNEYSFNNSQSVTKMCPLLDIMLYRQRQINTSKFKAHLLPVKSDIRCIRCRLQKNSMCSSHDNQSTDNVIYRAFTSNPVID